MGDISPHVSTAEIICPGTTCGWNGTGCKATTHDIILNNMLEDVCDHFLAKRPIATRVSLTVLSGNRCSAYDKEMKLREGYDYDPDKKPTEHSKFHAMDFSLSWVFEDGKREKISDDDIQNYLSEKYMDTAGIGRYRNRTHIDARRVKARWDKRRK